MSKKTFNLTDLTKAVYEDEDTNSSIFESNKKRIQRHINKMEKMLKLPSKRFEAPIEQLEAYVSLIRSLLDDAKNDDALNLLNRMSQGKSIRKDTYEKELTTLIEIFSDAEKQRLSADDNELFDKWLKDQLRDDFYVASEKNLNALMRMFKEDFSLFDDLNSLESKLEFQEQYMNDIRIVSAMYRVQVEEQLLFQECFLEVIKSHPHLNNKKMYTMRDFIELPTTIQQEIRTLIKEKGQNPPES